MVLYPDVQEKAIALLERVVGTSRLPTFQDRPSLIYIDAIMRECLRWRPVLPIGTNSLTARQKQTGDCL